MFFKIKPFSFFALFFCFSYFPFSFSEVSLTVTNLSLHDLQFLEDFSHLSSKKQKKLLFSVVKSGEKVPLVFRAMLKEATNLVNKKDLLGRTLLIRASTFDKVDYIKELLMADADKGLRDLSGYTSLSIAIKKGNKVIAKLLEEDKVLSTKEITYSTLLGLLRKNHLFSLKLSLERRPELLNRQDSIGMNLLMHASEQGNLAAVKLLLQSGAEVNQTDFVKSSALSRADNLAVAKELFLKDATVTLADLIELLYKKKHETLSFLLEKHPEFLIKTNRVGLSLFDLAQKSQTEMLPLLKRLSKKHPIICANSFIK